MAKEQQTVSDIFRRAMEVRRDHSQLSYKELEARLAEEYAGRPFPPLYNLTIPEQDARAPEEDWSAGLPIIRRGIQRASWPEIMSGIVLCLEQTENYERARGSALENWHDRSVGIQDSMAKGIGKWMPPDLLALAEKKGTGNK